MTPPKFRTACCLCCEPIPRASDVYTLDTEWQRRFPAMTGTLACASCAVHNNHWTCHAPNGALVAGHRTAARQPGSCIDSWNHIHEWGSHAGMVLAHPLAGLQQGAEEYLRRTLRAAGCRPEHGSANPGFAQPMGQAGHRDESAFNECGSPPVAQPDEFSVCSALSVGTRRRTHN
jgi:hypothetical protein